MKKSSKNKAILWIMGLLVVAILFFGFFPMTAFSPVSEVPFGIMGGGLPTFAQQNKIVTYEEMPVNLYSTFFGSISTGQYSAEGNRIFMCNSLKGPISISNTYSTGSLLDLVSSSNSGPSGQCGYNIMKGNFTAKPGVYTFTCILTAQSGDANSASAHSRCEVDAVKTTLVGDVSLSTVDTKSEVFSKSVTITESTFIEFRIVDRAGEVGSATANLNIQYVNLPPTPEPSITTSVIDTPVDNVITPSTSTQTPSIELVESNLFTYIAVGIISILIIVVIVLVFRKYS